MGRARVSARSLGILRSGQNRTGVQAGAGSGCSPGSVRTGPGYGPCRGSGPHCGGLAPPFVPEFGTAGQMGRGRGHLDQEVGILLLGVCLGSSQFSVGLSRGRF